MKKSFIYILTAISGLMSAQVAIGKSPVTNTSVSIEFGNIAGDATKQKGIILPWVSSVAGNPTVDYSGSIESIENGTMIFDLSDYKVKYRKNGSWFDLTVKNKTENITGITNNTVDSSLQDAKTEKPNAKASIGTPTATKGILVLEATDKAMILPIVDKYSSVVAPSAGMMVYDKANQMLCLYNGTVWTFWKP